MNRLVIRWLINAAALWAAAELVPGIGYENWPALFIVALIFGLVNALIRPILKLLTCPLQLLTLGLFTIVINALMLMLTSWLAQKWLAQRLLAQHFERLFWIDSFWPDAVLGALVVSVVSIVLSILLKDKDEEHRRHRKR